MPPKRKLASLGLRESHRMFRQPNRPPALRRSGGSEEEKERQRRLEMEAYVDNAYPPEEVPYVPRIGEEVARDQFDPLPRPRHDTGLVIGETGPPRPPANSLVATVGDTPVPEVPPPHFAEPREVGLPYPTDRASFDVKPDDWPGVNWRKVYKYRWTDGNQDVSGETGAFRTPPNYYGMARDYLSEGRKPVGLFRTSLRRFLDAMRVFRWYADKKEVVLLDYAPPPKFRDSASANPVLADHHSRRVFLYIVVPESRQMEYLEKYYPDPRVNAHRGRDSFFDHIRDYFVGIPRSVVEAFIKNKEQAQLLGRQESKKVTNPLRTEYPFQHWQVDLFDMRFAQLSNKGTTMVMVVIDCFSKFIYLRALKSKTDREVAWQMMNIFLSDGPPEILQSDNGGEFAGALIDVCKEFKVQKRYGREYNPSSQGQVERTNRTLKNSIYADFMRYDKDIYVDWLQHYAFTYNTTRQKTTGYSPMVLHRMRTVYYLPLEPVGVPGAADDNLQRERMAEQSERDILNGLSPRSRDIVLPELLQIHIDPGAPGVKDAGGGGPPPTLVPVNETEALAYVHPGDGTTDQKAFEEALRNPKPGEIKSYLTHTFLLQYVHFCTFAPFDVSGYLKREVDAKQNRDRDARFGINRGADAMIDRFLIKMHSDFAVGDLVRVDYNARENYTRHRANKAFTYQPVGRKWSTILYMIDSKSSRHGSTFYRLVTLPDKVPVPDPKQAYELYKVGGIEVGDVVRLDHAVISANIRRLFSSCMYSNRHARWTKALYKVVQAQEVDAAHPPDKMPDEPEDMYEARVADWQKHVRDVQDEVAAPDMFRMYQVEYLREYVDGHGQLVDLTKDTKDQRDTRLIQHGVLFLPNHLLKIDLQKLQRQGANPARPDLVFGYTGAKPTEFVPRNVEQNKLRALAKNLGIPWEQYAEMLRNLKIVEQITDGEEIPDERPQQMHEAQETQRVTRSKGRRQT